MATEQFPDPRSLLRQPPSRMPLIAVDPARPMGPGVRRAAEILRAGGLVAFPTETVYGLGANALDAEAVGRIFAAKGRPSYNPLIVHVASAEGAGELVRSWPVAASRAKGWVAAVMP